MSETSNFVMNPDDPIAKQKFRGLRDLLLKEAESKYSDSEKHLAIVRSAARKTVQSVGESIKYQCPKCKNSFAREDVMYISPNLLGDPMLGADAELRFHPVQFDEKGRALDAEGTPCSDIACPHCHEKLPNTWARREMAFRLPPKIKEAGGSALSEKKRK
jgi:hypothetical protein